jgi:hypothetical protein
LQDTDEIARGPHNPIYSSTKQRWVDDHLTIGEQQEIYAIAINQALYRPVAEGFPGFKRSHTILLEQLFENKKSPFNDLLNESTLKRLANSALFEELSCGGNYNKILENYGSILDPELFEKSSQFFDERNGLNQYSKFKFATGESIDNLSNYLDLSWETNPDMFKTPIIQKIVRSYLVHIIDLTDEEDPQYNKKEMALMTKKPWVNDFFNNDESVSKGMVQEVSRHLNVFSAHAFDFLISLPNPSRIFERSILNLSENQRGKLAKNYNLAFPIHLSDKYHSVMVDDLTKYQSSKEIVYRH